MLTSPLLGAPADKPELLIFGAASLTDALQEIGAAFTRDTGQAVRFSFASTAALARQIESGGRVDVFMSADLQWMDYLQARDLIDRSTRRNAVGNRLVLIAPSDSTVKLDLHTNAELLKMLERERLATGDPDSVPVGRYARSALISLGIWNQIENRLVRADNVRSALAFVARGETPLGVVYESDAAADTGVRVVAVFPDSAYPPITYPVAATVSAREGSKQFIAFLSTPSAQAIFKRFHFQPAPHAPNTR